MLDVNSNFASGTDSIPFESEAIVWGSSNRIEIQWGQQQIKTCRKSVAHTHAGEKAIRFRLDTYEYFISFNPKQQSGKEERNLFF